MSKHANNKNLKSMNSVKFSKKAYCEKVGNIILLNSTDEIKISFENTTYSIFFNKNDSVNVVNEKILGINTEKIQSLEFFDTEKKENLNEEEKNIVLMKDLINRPFSIRINKYITSNYIPGIFNQLFSGNDSFKNIIDENFLKINTSSDNLRNIDSLKNFILLTLFSLKERNANANKPLSNYEEEKKNILNDLITKLENRKMFLEGLHSKQTLAEGITNKKINFVNKTAMNLGMLFAISNFSVFYVLIYKVYAWDVMEPVAYIVNNIYWIITLGFLAFFEKKLDFDLLQYNSIKDIYFQKYAKQYNFSEEEKLKLEEELKSIEELKSEIINI